jgi:hypothetical protein
MPRRALLLGMYQRSVSGDKFYTRVGSFVPSCKQFGQFIHVVLIESIWGLFYMTHQSGDGSSFTIAAWQGNYLGTLACPEQRKNTLIRYFKDHTKNMDK